MKILFLCPRWGSKALEPQDFIRRARDAGYDGVEVGLSEGDLAPEESIALAQSEGMSVVAQHYETLDSNAEIHLALFERRLRHAASLAPAFINSHTGRDIFSQEENLAAFAVAEKVSHATGVRIVHETHRGRFLHAPWRATELLRAAPATKITFDMSHWCVVCESLCEDQAHTIMAILPAVEHIHARVGHAQAPQVSDPRAPEWRQTLEVHLAWWNRIVEIRRKSGAESLTFTPEFGPQPYLPALPFSGMPIASQWDCNLWMLDYLRAHLRAA